MRFLKGICCGTLALCAVLLFPCLAAGGQAANGGHSTTLELRSPEQMSAADAALVQAKHTEIATEAAFFGYTLSAGSWNYTQVLCPLLPDYLLLHYRQVSRRGAESLFTALVPRAAGRVKVVPVLYRNATPYVEAPSAPRTIAVFNRALPEETAASVSNRQGDWIELAMTYAAVAGAEPGLVMSAHVEPALYRAPPPTAEISIADRLQLVRFTDHDERGLYSVWDVSLDPHGRVTEASVEWHPIPPVEPEEETAAAPASTEIVPEPVQPENPPVTAPPPATPATPAIAAQPAAVPPSPAPAEPATAQSEPAEAPSAQPAPLGKLIPPAPPLKMQLIPEAPPRKEIPIPPRRQVQETPVPQR